MKDEKERIDKALGKIPGGGDNANKVICHVCGKTLQVMTLNRPVVVKCPDCGNRGAVY